MKRSLTSLGLVPLLLWSSPTPAAQDTIGPSNEEAADILREAQNTLRELNRISEALPREPIEPDQLVEHVLGKGGKGADQLTRWVAESVGWLPYRGALRGPRGVLIERRGNSLDQSLLLAEALRVTGLEVRLAHAVLPIEIARELHAAVRTPGVGSTVEVGTPAPETDREHQANESDEFDRYAKLLGVEAAQLRKVQEAQEIRAQQYLERVLPMAVSQSRDLKQLLAESGIERPSGPEDLETAEIEMLRDHWWVQSSNDGMEWTNHDPFQLRAGIDLALAPETTCLPEELPEAKKQRLTLRVVAERIDSTGLETNVALTCEAEATTLAGHRFLLGFRSLNPGRAEVPDGDERSEAPLLRIAEGETEWLPMILEIDYRGKAVQQLYESSIYTDGTLNPNPQIDTNSKKVSNAISALNDADKKPVGRRSHLTAVWLEYEISTPGGPPEIVRRNLFDLLGEARRRSGGQDSLEYVAGRDRERGLALLGQTEILPSTCRLSSDFLVRLVLMTRIQNQRLLVNLAQKMADEKSVQIDDVLNSFSIPPLDLYMLAQMRLRVGRYADRVHLGALNVLTSHFQPHESSERPPDGMDSQTEQTGLVFERSIDIVANGVDVLTPPGGQVHPPAAWDIRLEQGVLDTVLENLSLLASDERDTQAPDGDALARNPALWLERNPIRQWRALESGDAIAEGDVDTLVHIAAALDAGRVAVVPLATLAGPFEGEWKPACWWRVNPETGETLGFGPHGWGRGDDEYLSTLSVGARAINAIKQFAVQNVCVAIATTGRLIVGAIAGSIGEVLDLPLGVKIVMALLSQKGYTGRVFNFIEAACHAG